MTIPFFFYFKINTKKNQMFFWTTLVGVGVQSYMLNGELKKKKKNTQKSDMFRTGWK